MKQLRDGDGECTKRFVTARSNISRATQYKKSKHFFDYCNLVICDALIVQKQHLNHSALCHIWYVQSWKPEPRLSSGGHAVIQDPFFVLCKFHLDYLIFCWIIWKSKCRKSSSVCEMLMSTEWIYPSVSPKSVVNNTDIVTLFGVNGCVGD